MHLGKKMRRMSQVRGLTAIALAQYARVTPGFSNQREYSQTVPSLHTLERVAAALDVSLLYVLLEESRAAAGHASTAAPAPACGAG